MKNTIISIIALTLAVIFTVLNNSPVFAQFGQSSESGAPYSLWLSPDTDDFATIQQQVEDWFARRDKGRGSGYVQWKRWEFINENRLDANGKITHHAALNRKAYLNYLDNNSSRGVTSTNGSWYTLNITGWTNAGWGYNPGLGRVNCIEFHPTNTQTFWVGIPSGGLWRTTNHGATWIPLTDGLPSIGISGIVVDPSNTNIIYILTGDGDGGDTKTIGVLKSLNGGQTWNTTGLSYAVTDDKTGFKLIRHPANNNIIWAVMTDGLWRTLDGGVNWTNMRAGSYRDLEFKPGTPSTLYASSSNAFFRSVDDGVNWTQITSGLPSGSSRIAIGVTPNNANYIYLLCGPGGSGGNGSFKGVYRSTDSGVNFTFRSNTPNILGSSKTGDDDDDQSGYDLAIAVNRLDYGILMCGGINNWRSSDYGATWTISSHWRITDMPPGVDYVHADIHALDINPLNNRLYCGSDGGLFWSDNFGDDWYDISSDLDPTQWYRIADYEMNVDLLIGGTQDNGSNKYTGSSIMTHILGADGMDCAISHANSNTIYVSQQFGDFYKSTDGGNSFVQVKPAGSSGAWVTPLIMDPNNDNILYAGYSDVYRTADGGSSWTNLGSVGNRGLAMSKSNSSVIYAAGDFILQRSANSGSTWTTISSGLPSTQLITGIAVDPQDANQVWVTLDQFVAGQKVYYTANAAATTVIWNNITGTLPNTVMNCIVTDDGLGTDDVLYIGSDIGVFYTDASLNDWILYSNWLPVVLVFDLEINDLYNMIVAATYGRGLWRSETYSECGAVWNLAGDAPPGSSYYQASDYITSISVYNQGTGQQGVYKAMNYIKLNPGFKVNGGSKFRTVLGPCGGGF
jgi:photosystem II stability/assembly factor-like uncharacterized protein